MHKKVHQNIIFSIQRVKRNRLDSSSAKQLSPSLGPVQLKEQNSTVTLSFQKQEQKKDLDQQAAADELYEQNCMMDKSVAAKVKLQSQQQ